MHTIDVNTALLVAQTHGRLHNVMFCFEPQAACNGLNLISERNRELSVSFVYFAMAPLLRFKLPRNKIGQQQDASPVTGSLWHEVSASLLPGSVPGSSIATPVSCAHV